MKRQRRRWPVALMGAAVLSLAVSSAWQSAQAQSAPTFGSYTISATAPGWEMWEDEPSANAHPEGGGQAPYSTSALASGGLGYALSSIAWPGATEANVDKVALLLFPHQEQVPGGGPTVPVPDAVTQLAQTALPLARYPIRAEARTGEASADSAFPTGSDPSSATLKAHADPLLAQGTATMKSADGQAGFSFGNAETIATSVLNDNTGQATANSRISDINIGNVITIKSVESTATASTDSAASSSSGTTTVQGMKIAGQDAYVDEQGVHIGDQQQGVNVVASQIANKALSQGGFSFYVTQPQQTQDAAASTYTAGSLIIVWTPPSNPSGNTFMIALGGSRVSVTAAPGFAVNTPPAVTTPFSAPAAPSTGGSVSKPSTAPTPVTSAAPAAPAAKPTSTGTTAKPIAATFEGLGGQALLGLLGAGLMFFGFRRVADDIVDRVPSTCPLETT